MQSPIYWPVGSSLRFIADMANTAAGIRLAGTAVLVLTSPRKVPASRSPDRTKPLLEQKVYAFAAGKEAWVRTDLLEAIPVSMMSAYRSKRWPVQKS